MPRWGRFLRMALQDSPSIQMRQRLRSDSGDWRTKQARQVLANTWSSGTGNKLPMKVPPSGMKKKNVCSGTAGGNYAGTDWPI